MDRPQYQPPLATAAENQTTPATVTPDQGRNDSRPRYHRSEELLRKTLSMLCHFVWHRRVRAGEHMWTIPVDFERDFDCILSDAITELVRLRVASEHVEVLKSFARDILDGYNDGNVGDIDGLDLEQKAEALGLIVGDEDGYRIVEWLAAAERQPAGESRRTVNAEARADG